VGLSRRALLKQASAAIAALGLSDLALELARSAEGVPAGIPERAQAYAQAMTQAVAQPSGRRLALLVGVDRYANGAIALNANEPAAPLMGCATDVTLQKELLIHRFGFLPQDIVCLTNEQATRTGIYQAFESHLYNQAQSGDVVVVHFSGYGAQVRIENGNEGQQAVRSLVPFDGLLPTEARPSLNDISEIELKTLLGQLKTKNITTVLDTGFADILVPLSGGLRSRTRSAISTGNQPAPFPLLTRTRLAKESDDFPGVLLRAADVSDIVVERQWNGFHAGAFTYVLTQYLWSVPTSVSVGHALGRSQETLMRWGGSDQQPTVGDWAQNEVSGGYLGGARGSANKSLIYDTPLFSSTQGEGVIKAISADGKTATLWLGGLPPRVLEYLAAPATLVCNGRLLKLRSRTGLTAQAKLINKPVATLSNSGRSLTPLPAATAPLVIDSAVTDTETGIQVGAPVFEAVRILPKSIDLVVALDSRLERIERVDATSALSALSFVSSTSDTELPADCLLGKPLNNSPSTLTASLRPVKLSADVPKSASKNTPENAVKNTSKNPSEKTLELPVGEITSGYGLFSLTRSVIPGTLSLQDEAIKPAITRLSAKLRSLLALKMLRLSENRSSSQLPVRVVLEEVGPQEKRLVSRRTLRSQLEPEQLQGKLADADSSFIPQVSVGTRVRYRLFNDGDVPLYYTLINVDPMERLSAFCPVMGLSAQPTQPTEADNNPEAESVIAAASILPGSSVDVPSVDLDWSVEAPTGPVETYVVCSISPLSQTFNTLLAAAANSGKQRVSPLPNPLEVVEALLRDLSQGNDPDTYSLNVAHWATLNFTYQAV
jgi:hypothetical protein